MSPRPSRDEVFMIQAALTATRGTCARRQVGCILTNVRGHVLATGYNGVASGMPHCIDQPCPGAHLPSGTGLDECEALHAEQNALLQCSRPYEIHTCYVTASPCITCIKLLLNTSCQRIVFSEEYPHSKAHQMWLQSGREWVKLPINQVLSTPRFMGQ